MTTEIAVQRNETAVVERSEWLSLKQVTDRVNLVHQVLEKVMVKGTHYGTVPGCGAKDVLLKPGADLLAMTFRLVPQFKAERIDLEGGHREYDVTCSMFGPSGELLGQGVGSASTMEKKYRYRKDASGKRIENEDIADVYNTVLKIAKKRAHIDATLTVTGAADIFFQDLIEEDDAPPKHDIRPPQSKSAAQAPPAPPQPPPEEKNWGNPNQPDEIPGDEEPRISEAQSKRFYAIWAGSNRGTEEMKAYIFSKIGSTHTKDIPRRMYDEMCAYAEKAQ
ncbi:MAG: hypothetical protein M0R00_07720 [Candidatus Omnitrophica bacterium]|jgi:hypothetical protein|nr:hypothetical protein [Candidatus Omnitrophota bacterium]